MEGATCSSCAPDGSHESVKCRVRQEANCNVMSSGYSPNDMPFRLLSHYYTTHRRQIVGSCTKESPRKKAANKKQECVQYAHAH